MLSLIIYNSLNVINKNADIICNLSTERDSQTSMLHYNQQFKASIPGTNLSCEYEGSNLWILLTPHPEQSQWFLLLCHLTASQV